jgi:plastocyanin
MLRFTRRSAAIAALTCALVAPAAAQAAPGPVDVQLRVETPTETLFNGGQSTSARTGARGVNLTPSPPDPNSCTHAYDPITWGYVKQDIPDVTALTVAADFADAEGLDHIVKDFGWGHLLCGIGALLGDNSQFWLVKINNKTQTSGGGFITADTAVNPGDEVLWYFTNASITHTLDLDLPSQVFVGEYANGTVTKYSNNTDAATPARGASVSGGGASGVTDVNGKVRLKFGEPGAYLVSAAANGSTRGSDVIEVLPAPSPAATSKARRVCAKYRRGWRKYNKRYKRIYKRCLRSAKRRYGS